MVSSLSEITVFPLVWPAYLPRTSATQRKRAVKTKPDGFAAIEEELDHWGVVDPAAYVVSANIHPMRPVRVPDDPGASLWMTLPQGHEMEPGAILAFAADRVVCPQENMLAIAQTMEKLRRASDLGIYPLARAVMGAVVYTPPFCWWRELGFDDAAAVDAELVNDRFRQLAKKHHPDAGGSEAAFKRLVRAKGEADRALASIKQ